MDRHEDSALHELEQSWIAAETEADHLKDLADRAAIAADELRKSADAEKPEVKLLLGQAETYAERRARAEADAVAAFDRFWLAKGSR
ncbi:MAG: hypothetical protein AAFR23_08810 [Pseudomonadota bacterium]